MNLHKAEFIKSAADSSGFLRDLPCIVFSGKSNVGKSSVINKLLNRNKLAKSSSTPGKTVHVNYFNIDNCCYFVDLPGYGYAKVQKSEKDRWSRLMERFFSERSLISLGVMIVDSRHRPTADDIIMAKWFKETACPMVLVANKCDKLKKSEIEPNMALIRETLELPENVRQILFSASNGTGRDELLDLIEQQVSSSDET